MYDLSNEPILLFFYSRTGHGFGAPHLQDIGERVVIFLQAGCNLQQFNQNVMGKLMESKMMICFLPVLWHFSRKLVVH